VIAASVMTTSSRWWMYALVFRETKDKRAAFD
jgi:hypothetical protein